MKMVTECIHHYLGFSSNIPVGCVNQILIFEIYINNSINKGIL